MAQLVYRFQFPDGRTESLDAGAGAPRTELPHWTELGFHQCANCPLSTAQTKHCPMAVRLVPLVALFENVRSYDDVTAQVESDERTVTRRTSVQKVLRKQGDSSVNALVLLDLFAHSLPDSIDADLEELLPAFQESLKMNYDRSADHG